MEGFIFKGYQYFYDFDYKENSIPVKIGIGNFQYIEKWASLKKILKIFECIKCETSYPYKNGILCNGEKIKKCLCKKRTV